MDLRLPGHVVLRRPAVLLDGVGRGAGPGSPQAHGRLQRPAVPDPLLPDGTDHAGRPGTRAHQGHLARVRRQEAGRAVQQPPGRRRREPACQGQALQLEGLRGSESGDLLRSAGHHERSPGAGWPAAGPRIRDGDDLLARHLGARLVHDVVWHRGASQRHQYRIDRHHGQSRRRPGTDHGRRQVRDRRAPGGHRQLRPGHRQPAVHAAADASLPRADQGGRPVRLGRRHRGNHGDADQHAPRAGSRLSDDWNIPRSAD